MAQSQDKFYRKLMAMAVGNCMEFFDFSCFGALADIIGEEFFPEEHQKLQLLKSLSIFGAAFIMRPIGGIVIGRIGDRYGRKLALEISIISMLLSSFIMGCLPSYKQWGYFSTILLVCLRLIQGLACGGELVGAFIYTIEQTNGKYRGFFGGLCKSTGNMGSTLGLGIVALLRSTLSPGQLRNFGWRIPFLLSIVFGTIGIYLRSQLEEETPISHVYDANESSETFILTSTSVASPENKLWFRSYMFSHKPFVLPSNVSHDQNMLILWWKEILIIFLIASFWCCGYYSMFVWLMYFISKESLINGTNNIDSDTINQQTAVPFAWTINFSMNLCLVFMLPIGGFIGDMIGYCTTYTGNIKSSKNIIKIQNQGFRFIMMVATFLAFSLSIVAFGLLTTKSSLGTIYGQGIFVFILGLFGGNLPALMVSQFNRNVCYSGIGAAYNLAHAVFSSTASIIQTELVTSAYSTRSNQSFIDNKNHIHLHLDLLHDGRLRPAYYLMLISAISFTSLLIGIPWVERLREKRENQEVQLLQVTQSKFSFSPTAPSLNELNEDDDKRLVQAIAIPLIRE